jgi:hypothetical protein
VLHVDCGFFAPVADPIGGVARNPRSGAEITWCRPDARTGKHGCSRRKHSSPGRGPRSSGADVKAGPWSGFGPPSSPTPRAPTTRAAQLNRIECHLSAIGEFVVNNANYADYADWNTFKKAVA